MEIYLKNIFYFHISLFLVFTQILSDALHLPISQLQTQRVMTPQIRSHVEYLIQNYYISAHFVVEIDEKSSLMAGLIRLNDDS